MRLAFVPFFSAFEPSVPACAVASCVASPFDSLGLFCVSQVGLWFCGIVSYLSLIYRPLYYRLCVLCAPCVYCALTNWRLGALVPWTDCPIVPSPLDHAMPLTLVYRHDMSLVMAMAIRMAWRWQWHGIGDRHGIGIA